MANWNINHNKQFSVECYKYYLNLKMSHYNYTNAASMAVKQGNNDMGSLEKLVMSNAKESIEKHLSNIKIDQNQLNYALFLCIEHFKLDEHTDECMLMLLRHKANPNCEFNKETPLTVACRKGQQLLVKLLLQYGAKPDLCNKNGEHPLAVILNDRRQNHDVAQALINCMNSVNIEIGGRFPIVIAVERQFYRIFQMLIEKGANLIFESQNILHVIAKQKFKRLQKKKKFIKQLSGRSNLMQQDSAHKLPTEYQQNQQIKQLILDNFKPKIVKQQSYKQQPNSKVPKQKETKQTKNKDGELNKQGKKKNSGNSNCNSNSKQLDGSFSQLDEEEFHEQKTDLAGENKLKEVVQVPDQQERIQEKKQVDFSSPIMKSTKMAQINNLSATATISKDQKLQKMLDPQSELLLTLTQKQKEQQKDKIKKKLNSSIGLTESKKKLLNNNDIVNITIGNKKKKGKAQQQIIPKTLLKRKNSSIQQQLSKGQKNKVPTAKKTNTNKKQAQQSPQKAQKQRSTHQEDKNVQARRMVIFKQFADLGLHIEQQKIQKQSETDSQQSCFEGSLATLNEQIFDLVNKINIKNAEKLPVIQQILKFLQSAIRQQLQKIKQGSRLQLYVYGSQSTQLAIQNSDIDVLLVTQFQTGALMKIFQQQGTLEIDGIRELKFITGATMPVIKLQMNQKFGNTHIDITFHSKNHMGLKCSEMIKAFIQVQPLIRPLVLVLKTLVEAYDISDPYKGGISSYALTLMVIALLQFTQRDKKKIQNVGELLLNFLYFYGQQIDYVSQAIIIHDLGLFGDQPVYCIYRLPYLTDLNPKLIIYDPLNPVNNVGRTAYRISALKKLFSLSYLRFKQEQGCRLADIMDGSFSQILTDF